MRDKFSSVKSCTTRYRKYHINIAILISLLFSITLIGSQYLYSQEGVRIKERVEIGSREIARADSLIIKKNEKTMFTSGEVASGFIMPKSGELQIYYVYCNRLDYKLPANASLIVHFLRGDSSKADCIISRFPNVTPWSRLIYNACYGINQYRYQYNYTNTGYSEDVYVYNVGTVTEGDTIQFFYSSNNIVTGDSVLYAIYNADLVAACSWDVVFGDYDWCIGDFNDELNIYVKVESNEILLGETKYYFVRDNSGSAYIDTTTDPDVNPGVQNGSIWSNNPVSIVTCEPNSGRRLGVYWEKKKPDGTDLPSGMIRLIGRYWHEDSIYKVKLTAVYNGDSLSKIIEVKKPVRLLTPGQSPTYRLSRDVFNNEINIDSICIYYGGKSGIPPQIIKGQMFQEAAKYNYGGEIGWGFAASYRYEPWTDIWKFRRWYELGRNDFLEQPFVVTQNSMGTGKQVPVHYNVMPLDYPRNPTRVGRHVVDNWDQYFNSAEEKFIGLEEESEMNKWWQRIKSYYLKLYKNDFTKVISAARELIQSEIIEYRQEYAQTRKCASYGVIQIMYETARSEGGYNRGKSRSQPDTWDRPEDLNDHMVSMPFYEVFTLKNLKEVIGDDLPQSNWKKGFERTWIDVVQKYNKCYKGYGGSVIDNSKKFMPLSK